MIKAKFVRTGTVNHFNRKAKGQFVRTFNNLYELSDWMNKVWMNVCFVDIEKDLTEEQIKWLNHRRRSYLENYKKDKVMFT